MQRRPLLLDLFCGAGGASAGYVAAGFDVVGVDLHPQPNYPYRFVQADALAYLVGLLDAGMIGAYHSIHASPPCQRHSRMSSCRPGLAETYPDLIAVTRALLDRTQQRYVIENVPGAPLRADVTLCGRMYGLRLYRHRLFESNVPLVAPAHPAHDVPGSAAGHWKPGTIISVSGNCAPMVEARAAMGIDWTTRAELVEAIPPAFSLDVGRQLLAA